MNLERFHALINTIIADADRVKYVQKFDQLLGSIQARINDPNNASLATAVDNNIVELQDLLLNLDSNQLTSTFQLYATEYGLDLFFGDRLADAVDEILDRNQLT